MTPVLLHGWLAERFGAEFRLDVASPAEAIQALCCTLQGFREAFGAASFHVLVGDEPQTLETVGAPAGHLPIHLVPVVAGGKDGITSILSGAALIGISFIPGMAPWAANALMGLGVSMAIGGVAQVLAGSPPIGGPDNDQVQNGHFFDGATNTNQQGCCIPVGYGEMEVGSIVPSAGTSAETYPSGAGGGPFGANGTSWSKVGNVWTNSGDGVTLPLCLGVDPV